MGRSAGVTPVYPRSRWHTRTPNAIAFAVATLLHFAAPASAAETVIAGGVSSGSTNLWPIHIGIRKGFFHAEGINVDLVFAQSNASVIQQLAANSINVSVGSGLVDPIRAVEKGAPVALIRIETQRPPYALLAKPVLKSIADLKGKTVSVGGPKDITRIFLERMLVPSGVQAGDVDLIFAGATSARMAALQSGAADAALLTTPYNFHAEAAGYDRRNGGHPIFRRFHQPQLGEPQHEDGASLSGGLFESDPVAREPRKPSRGH
jgi:NitT/TauT family transport system substrate-binding protein